MSNYKHLKTPRAIIVHKRENHRGPLYVGCALGAWDVPHYYWTEDHDDAQVFCKKACGMFRMMWDLPYCFLRRSGKCYQLQEVKLVPGMAMPEEDNN